MIITDEDIAKFKASGYNLQSMITEFSELLLNATIKEEVDQYLASYRDQKLPNGTNRLVLNGSYSRDILTGAGKLTISIPTVRDRGSGDDKLRFHPSMIPKFLRRLDDVGDMIPFLYLKGVSTTEVPDVLAQLFKTKTPPMRPSTVSNLLQTWTTDYNKWLKRDLSEDQEYPYIFADGIFFPIRGDKENQVVLTLIGVDSTGTKELLALGTGFAERSEYWEEMFLGLKERGMAPPKLVIGDAGKGLWKGLGNVYPDCAKQTCFVHKIRNVVSHLPKKLWAQARKDLGEIRKSGTRQDAEEEIKKFERIYGKKYPDAVDSLNLNKDMLLTFYDFPAEHWKYIRSTNIIESIFSTIRTRTNKMRGVGDIKFMSAMTYKLVEVASKKFHKFPHSELLADVSKGMKYVDGLPAKTN